MLYSFLKANWRAMAELGTPLMCELSQFKAKRSTAANKRYWKILRDIAEFAWVDGKRFSAEAWHSYYASMLIGQEECPNGSMVPISTTTLSVAEFSDYCDRIIEYSISELGIEYECAA